MAVVHPALLDTRAAFDGVASSYDRSNEESQTLCAMRTRVLSTVRAHVPEGSNLLDLGCGPGRDDEVLAGYGYAVTAIDWSPGMVAEAAARIHRAGLDDRVTVKHLGIQDVERLAPARFDAAFSNFGPLNCVPNLPHAARLIGNRLRPGGVVVASVIGRVCPWEIALYAARRDWARLGVRFTRGFAAIPLEGRTVWTRYYTTSEFVRAFADAGFRCVSLRALGLFVPPPYMDAFARRHRGLTSALQRLDDSLGALPGLRRMGDHFLVVLRKD